MFKTMTDKLKLKLKEIQHAALTSDLWTSIATDGYITATCHFIDNDVLNAVTLETRNIKTAHTGDNLNIVIQSILDKWNLKGKIEAIVTDNAKNIVNGVEYSLNNSLRCTAHTLQLAVKDSIYANNEVKNILEKCKAIVCHFKKSTTSLDKLRKIQKNLNLKVLKFVQEVISNFFAY
jgi:hypothetical protein